MPVGQWIKGIVGRDSIIKDLFDGIDKITTTEAEAQEAKALVIKKFEEYENTIERHVTERHKADMESDSWMSKNIRPMVLIYLLLVYTLLSILDGNIAGMKINEGYVELLGQWGITVMSFYFSSRGIEKVTQLIATRKYEKK